MSLPVGSGRCQRFCSIVCSLSLAFASDVAFAVPQFVELTSVTLAPEERAIAFVHQHGADLIVKVVDSNGNETIQDGPDLRFGTEVVALANTSAEVEHFDVAVARKFADVMSEHTFEVVANAAPDVFERAVTVSSASQTWYTGQTLDSAIGAWGQVAGDDEIGRTARLLQIRGLIMTSQYQAAITLVDKTATLDTGLYGTYLLWQRAGCLGGLRRHADAIAAYESLLPLLEALGATTEEILIKYNILADYGTEQILRGFQSNELDMMAPGAALVEEALAQTQPYNDLMMLGDLTSDLAMYYAMSGDWALGLHTLYVAQDVYEQAGSPISLISVKSNIGYHHLRLGQVGDALQYYREALQMKTPGGTYADGLATIYARLGLIYKKMGDYYKSAIYYDKATRLLRDLGLEEQVMDAELEIGEVLRLRGDRTAALSKHRSLVDRITLDGWNDGWLRLQIGLANDYLALGRSDQARAHIDALSADRQARRDRGDEVSRVPAIGLDLASAVARYWLAIGEPASALRETRDALADLDPLQESERQIDLLYLKSVASDALGEHEAALEAGQEALDLIKTIRGQVDISRLAATWSARASYVTDHQVALLLTDYLSAGRKELVQRAFDILQHSRAISLRQARVRSLIRTRRQDEQAEIKELWDNMLQDKRAVLAAAAAGRPVAELESTALASEEAYRTYQPGVLPADSAPLYYASIEEVQAQLADRTALVFVMGDPRGFAIHIDKGDVRVFPLPSEGELADLIQRSLFELSSSSSSATFDATSRLGALLLGPLERVPRQIIVESDRTLNRVPFGALALANESRYVPLVDRSSVINVPSLSTYLEPSTTEKSGRSRLSAVVVADPAIADFEVPATLASADGEFQTWRNKLRRLEYTALEAHHIVDVFGHGNTRLLEGKDATIANLMSPDVRSARVLHLASHGFSSDTDPHEVGFLLSDEPDNANAGLLTVEEILQHRFDVDLVVISGCDTARGQILAGEGMMGLARAFMTQGSKSVLATLWPISDRASAEFMDDFYDELVLRHKQPAEALRLAQNRLRATPRYKNPWFWAPFTLYMSSKDIASGGSRR